METCEVCGQRVIESKKRMADHLKRFCQKFQRCRVCGKPCNNRIAIYRHKLKTSHDEYETVQWMGHINIEESIKDELIDDDEEEIINRADEHHQEEVSEEQKDDSDKNENNTTSKLQNLIHLKTGE